MEHSLLFHQKIKDQNGKQNKQNQGEIPGG